MPFLDHAVLSIIARGDLAHLALFVWAVAVSMLLALTLRELGAANRRFDGFIRELSKFNRRYRRDLP
jgi:hypothetical protein